MILFARDVLRESIVKGFSVFLYTAVECPRRQASHDMHDLLCKHADSWLLAGGP